MSNDVKRGRVWQIVFYPESCPNNFEEIIYDWHIPAVLSPIHNPSNNKDGKGETEGKEHYHLNLYFDGNKSYEQILYYADQLNTKRLIRVENARSMTRYLIHIDDPDKEQFHLEQIKAFGGVSFLDYFMQSSNDIQLASQLEHIIIDNRIDNFAVLMCYLKKKEETEILNYLRFKSSYYAKSLIEGVFDANRKGLVLNEEEL